MIRRGGLNRCRTYHSRGVRFPDFAAEVWFGLVAPAKTPKEAVSQLAGWFTAAMQLPEKATLVAQGLYPVGKCGADFGAFIHKQYDEFGRVIRAANINADACATAPGQQRPTKHRASMSARALKAVVSPRARPPSTMDVLLAFIHPLACRGSTDQPLLGLAMAMFRYLNPRCLASQSRRYQQRPETAGLTPNYAADSPTLAETPMLFTPREFGGFMAAETKKWGNVIRAANIKVE